MEKKTVENPQCGIVAGSSKYMHGVSLLLAIPATEAHAASQDVAGDMLRHHHQTSYAESEDGMDTKFSSVSFYTQACFCTPSAVIATAVL